MATRNQTSKKTWKLCAIRFATRAPYYVLDDPEISDAEYDKLLNQLKKIEAEHPELVRRSRQTQTCGR